MNKLTFLVIVAIIAGLGFLCSDIDDEGLIIYEKNLEVNEMRTVLHDLRQSLEDRIKEKNQELRVPALLRFKVPEPIELGI
jgi:hypothetical protein